MTAAAGSTGSLPSVPPEAMRVIDGFIDELAASVDLASPDGRRLVLEATDHLVAGTQARMAAGSAPVAAARSAVADFGAPGEIASAQREALVDGPSSVLFSLVDLVLRIGIVGMLAVAASGALSAVAGRLWGAAFVAGDTHGVTYTAQRCAQYLALVPGSRSCAEAASVHHWGEVVDGRVSALLLAAIGLVIWLVLRRRPGYRRAPDLLLGVLGVALFSLAAVVLGLVAVSSLGEGGAVGAGAPLSAAICAGAAALVFVPPLVRGVRAGARPDSRVAVPAS